MCSWARHRLLIREASPTHWDILCIPRDHTPICHVGAFALKAAK